MINKKKKRRRNERHIYSKKWQEVSVTPDLYSG